MANTDDTVSMVGAPPRMTQNIDHYSWGRAALDFTGVTVEQHEMLAEHMGAVAAAEVILVIAPRKYGKTHANGSTPRIWAFPGETRPGDP